MMCWKVLRLQALQMLPPPTVVAPLPPLQTPTLAAVEAAATTTTTTITLLRHPTPTFRHPKGRWRPCRHRHVMLLGRGFHRPVVAWENVLPRRGGST